MDTNRKTAYRILHSMEREGSYSNLAINRTIGANKPDDPAFVRQLVYGVTENQILLDYLLDQLMDKGVQSLRGPAKILLRMGVYQAGFLDSVPDYAAVSETVNLCRRVAKGREGLVNGVLRNYIRRKEQLTLPDEKLDETQYLSVKYSCDPSLVALWLQQRGREETEQLLAFAATVPPVYVRANFQKTGITDLAEAFDQAGYETAVSAISPRVLAVRGRDILSLPAYQKGWFSVQNQCSTAIADWVQPEPGQRVIDLCSAPGGKAMAMAEAMHNQGSILACDLYPHRLELIEKEQTRLGLSIVEPCQHDSRQWMAEWAETADRVLADVPCSGTGVIREKPDLKYKPILDGGAGLAQVQGRILQSGFGYLKPGGRLVYSTCTLNQTENQQVTGAFLAEAPDATCLFEKEFLPVDGCDGFYVCVIEKRKETPRR